MVDILVSSVLQVILFSVLPLIWWAITARKKEGFFKWIGLKKPILKDSVKKLLLIILAISMVYMLIMMLVMTRILVDTDTATSQFANKGLAVLPSILIYALVQTGLSEEILFRGFLGKRLINRFGFAGGNTVQAFVFGLMHGIPFGLATGNLLVAIILTILPGSLGWIQGWLNEKYASGSIVPSWIMHSFINFLSALSVAL